MPVTPKTFQWRGAFLKIPSTMKMVEMGWSTVTSDHKIRRQSILQDSKILLLQRLSYASFLQAKGTIMMVAMFKRHLLCLQNEGHT